MISGSHHYDVYIDPDFMQDQRQSILNAIIEWQVDTENTITFTLIGQKTSQDPIIVILHSDQEHMQKWYHDTTIGHTEYRGADSNIQIATDLGKRDFHECVLHEIGHALGLEHDEDGTIMAPDTSEASSFLTCRDMHAFCKVWGCDARQFILCGGGKRE